MSCAFSGSVSARGQVRRVLDLGRRPPRWHQAKAQPRGWEAWLFAIGRQREKWCDECTESTGLNTWEPT